MMLDYMIRNHYDVVSGWRKNRKDTFMKRFVSRGANLLRYLLVHDGIHDSGCSLKIYRQVLKVLIFMENNTDLFLRF